MAITGTKAFVSEVLTSADVNQYLMRGVKVFGGTATRDAAYGGAGEPVLEEGETCYLTDIDKVQVYGGTATGWIEVGPTTPAVRATDLAWVQTSQSTSSTSYTDLSTVGPSVTLTTGTSVIVLHGCFGDDDGNLGNNAWQSVDISGATTTAASDDWATLAQEADNGLHMMLGYKFTVTAGSNTFTCKYKKSGGTSTASFSKRWIMVIAL